MTVQHRVPFNRLRPVGQERRYLEDAIRSGGLSGTGTFGRRCEELIEKELGGGRVLLTTSATAALEMAAMLANLGPGDEVVMPSFTFVSAANAVVLHGSRIVFADVDADTMNLCPDDARSRLSEHTKAIIPIDYAGVSCDIEQFGAMAIALDILCIEDAAQGIGSRDPRGPLGRGAPLSVISFHDLKNIGCGEGGALIVNDESDLARALVLRDKGTNRQRFISGEVDKYTWIDAGSSYAISELSAAFLLGQLERLPYVTENRVRLWDLYAERLKPARDRGLLRWNDIPAGHSHNGHIFYMFLQNEGERDRFIAHMAAASIQTFFHYVPLHLSPMGHEMGYRPGDLPITEDLSARLVRLPIYATLDPSSAHFVSDTVLAFFGLEP